MTAPQYNRTPFYERGPKKCPACKRVLPRSSFYASGGKCKPCYIAHRVTSGTDTSAAAQTRAPQGRHDAAESEGSGPDYMYLAQVALFPGREYTALLREECGAIRRHALALFTAAGQRMPRERKSA